MRRNVIPTFIVLAYITINLFTHLKLKYNNIFIPAYLNSVISEVDGTTKKLSSS